MNLVTKINTYKVPLLNLVAGTALLLSSFLLSKVEFNTIEIAIFSVLALTTVSVIISLVTEKNTVQKYFETAAFLVISSITLIVMLTPGIRLITIIMLLLTWQLTSSSMLILQALSISQSAQKLKFFFIAMSLGAIGYSFWAMTTPPSSLRTVMLFLGVLCFLNSASTYIKNINNNNE